MKGRRKGVEREKKRRKRESGRLVSRAREKRQGEGVGRGREGKLRATHHTKRPATAHPNTCLSADSSIRCEITEYLRAGRILGHARHFRTVSIFLDHGKRSISSISGEKCRGGQCFVLRPMTISRGFSLDAGRKGGLTPARGPAHRCTPGRSCSQ